MLLNKLVLNTSEYILESSLTNIIYCFVYVLDGNRLFSETSSSVTVKSNDDQNVVNNETTSVQKYLVQLVLI